jgi:hypothetical protein
MVLKNKIINVYIARDGDSNIYYHILDPFVNKKSYIIILTLFKEDNANID